VVGVADADLGERVKAIVVVGADVTAVDLAHHLEGRIAAFKVPEEWEFRRTALPRTPSGKVIKRSLREGEPSSSSGDSAL
jgi:acyl-CoA synthetase (AMP-forming)/AMP-acid ligase II